ncbi:MAG: hypothetical protein LBU83_02795 [Bacteroidales bacterium]|jgi:hypothetical protein|nr:hypothetical protein [Bacteroidales bacterium]
MIQIKTFSDDRLDAICSYCGNVADTRDHVPSKILLDEPYPENLPVVPCCLKCNNEISLDEEYFACMLECLICGTVEIEKLSRQKIKNVLNKRKTLHRRLSNSIVHKDSDAFLNLETERLRRVFIKLAKGHMRYENGEPIIDEPSYLSYKPLSFMTAQERMFFFALEKVDIFPEVVSRAMIKMVESNATCFSWENIQPDTYSYAVDTTAFIVKIVIRNYMSIEVRWSTH